MILCFFQGIDILSRKKKRDSYPQALRCCLANQIRGKYVTHVNITASWSTVWAFSKSKVYGQWDTTSLLPFILKELVRVGLVRLIRNHIDSYADGLVSITVSVPSVEALWTKEKKKKKKKLTHEIVSYADFCDGKIALMWQPASYLPPGEWKLLDANCHPKTLKWTLDRLLLPFACARTGGGDSEGSIQRNAVLPRKSVMQLWIHFLQCTIFFRYRKFKKQNLQNTLVLGSLSAPTKLSA